MLGVHSPHATGFHQLASRTALSAIVSLLLPSPACPCRMPQATSSNDDSMVHLLCQMSPVPFSLALAFVGTAPLSTLHQLVFIPSHQSVGITVGFTDALTEETDAGVCVTAKYFKGCLDVFFFKTFLRVFFYLPFPGNYLT